MNNSDSHHSFDDNCKLIMSVVSQSDVRASFWQFADSTLMFEVSLSEGHKLGRMGLERNIILKEYNVIILPAVYTPKRSRIIVSSKDLHEHIVQ